jgi:site-specific recombinase XerD
LIPSLILEVEFLITDWIFLKLHFYIKIIAKWGLFLEKILFLFKKDISPMYSQNTIKTYLFELKQFNDWLTKLGSDILNYENVDFNEYVNFLISKKNGPATINKVFYSIKTFSSWTDRFDIKYIRKVKQKKDVKSDYLDSENIKQILESLKSSDNKRDLAIIMVILYTGIKVSECVSLNRSNIDFKNQILVMHKKTINLQKDTLNALKNYIDSRADRQVALFLSNRNKRISIRTIQFIFKKYNIRTADSKHYLKILST